MHTEDKKIKDKEGKAKEETVNESALIHFTT